MFFKFQRSRKISALSPDRVQIVTGKVVAAKEMKISGTDIQCACYWMMIETWEHGARGRGRKMWVPSGTRQGCSGFFVEDETGKVWVGDNGDSLDIRNGWENLGPFGKKGKQRFVSRCIKSGDVIRIRGTIRPARGAEPGDCMVVNPDAKGVISILQKRRVKP